MNYGYTVILCGNPIFLYSYETYKQLRRTQNTKKKNRTDAVGTAHKHRQQLPFASLLAAPPVPFEELQQHSSSVSRLFTRNMNEAVKDTVQTLCREGNRELVLSVFHDYPEHFSCIPLNDSNVESKQAINDLLRENVSAHCSVLCKVG